MKKEVVKVVTLGCSKNTVDSERLIRQIKANRIRLSDKDEEVDTIIINTCGFIEAAKEESINAILEAVKLKNDGVIKKVVVAGCLSGRYADDLKNEISDVDNYFGVEEYEGIIKSIGGKIFYDLLGERSTTTPPHYAYLKISEGCDNPCSFCAIPLIRGHHRSIPMEKLLHEAEKLAETATKELIIIGQDTTDYGIDLYGKRNASELLDKLSRIKNLDWIRLMYAYPSHFPDDLIDMIAANPKIVKYIDMPLQHIADDCLKSMRRGITKRRTIELIEKLRNKIPNLVLRTTLIVGYPSETEAHFEELCQFVKEYEFERLGVFTFSAEENTPSFILGDPIPEKVKNERKNILMDIQQEISSRKNQELIGTTTDVIIDSIEGEHYVGRSYRDAPEVDGEVLIPISTSKAKIGKSYKTIITDANEYDLYGDIVK